MKSAIITIIALFALILPNALKAQDKAINPSKIITGEYHGETPPLKDLPVLTDAEWQLMQEKAERKVLNPRIRTRSFPFAESALPKGADPVWQRNMGAGRDAQPPLQNFNGQTSPYYPPDANGTVGPEHYMQTINTVYAIYNKAGNLVAGPSALNTLFSGVTGSECNNGDPIVLYDEQADRWLVAEFSLCGVTDYMLIAVSTTNDPTGTWHKYSFDVDDMPDYEKFGIWQDGYYMGTNTSPGNDIYVFERSQMLTGGTARAVAFDNPWRPGTIDGFMCVPPLDNDGVFAPEGSPGLFITLNDDAIGGGTDQLWIYELQVDWQTLSNSTFTRTQQLNVAAFDSNFGNDWDNIKQAGTSRELDAIPQVIMNPPQYRNFGSYETILCCHTVDADDTDHAGIRWYELRRLAGGDWTIRQNGTYAPDEHSRWMGSIMLNGQNEIALGYSISSSSMYPGIRYCGQSSSAYETAAGIMDVTEVIIQSGNNSQTAANRWGDYAALQIDPTDDETFWFTSQYIGSEGVRNTKIASFQIGPAALAANFTAENTKPVPNAPIVFTDLSTGGQTSWNWSFTPNTVTFHDGTSISSQNPRISFNQVGYYTVSLYVSNGSDNDTEIKANYIHAYTPGLWSGTVSSDWNTEANWDGSVIPTTGTSVTIPSTADFWPAYTGNFSVGTQCEDLSFYETTQMTVSGDFTINPDKALNMAAGGLLNITGDWVNNGNFIQGNGTVKFTGTEPVSVETTLTEAEIANYAISTFSKGMTALTGATSGPGGDDNNSNIPIGFSFNYAGTSYSTTKISTNGWLSLNLTGELGYSNSALFSSTTPNATITAWWDDLRADAISAVYYKTEGTAPYRIFTAEWSRILTHYTGATARISYQVKLFETTNVIEFHYGNAEEGTHYISESASIGIENAIGGTGHFKEATGGSSTIGVIDLNSSSNWPTVNYRFTPASLKQTFKNLTINNTGGPVYFNVDTDVNGVLNVMPEGSFRVSNGTTLTVKELTGD